MGERKEGKLRRSSRKDVRKSGWRGKGRNEGNKEERKVEEGREVEEE